MYSNTLVPIALFICKCNLKVISEINTLKIAPKEICKKLKLDEMSSWQTYCAAILDYIRPMENREERVSNL